MIFHKRQVASVTVPKSRFLGAPKSSAYPPPKERAPTVNNEKPIAVTTHAAAIGEISLRQYFAKSPNVPSKIPPIMTHPMTVG